MKFHFVPISFESAQEIADWNYEGKFADLYMTPYFISGEKNGVFTGPGGCDGFVAMHEGAVSGLFEFTIVDGGLEIGLALAPDLVGKGIGPDFVKQGIAFGLKQYEGVNDYIQLEVAAANKPAMRVYEKVGFVKTNQSADQVEMRLEVRRDV
ncbi:GNAT family N-acetyltransferase [Guptibacillus hwajinpoensis]|uniref:GNAT family N-acetyltransferase n=1 Tax=Guptibacillus hwajinpoensis TaxID=208199 RepID=UPI001CFDCD0A|nr:GNAT family protein [Pseudalkalibacillus hwajinpoensis]WLR59078.1 GNAT family protein [Pseudalkalibacillus hwajinpoensis]